MESITKNRQSLGTLRAMCERAYGPGRVPGGDDWVSELGHGWFNVAYRVELSDGTRAVLKIAPPPDVEVMTYERGAMATELAALELIREHTDVPVPAVHFADRGRELCDADWFLMEFVDGDNLGIIEGGLTADQNAAYAELIGAATAELNTIAGPHFGSLAGGRTTATWRAAFTGMLGDVLGDGERRAVDLGRGYDDLRALVERHAWALDEVTRPVFVEWDLWPSNVMVAGGRVAAIIDHERAFWGDPLMEAGFLELHVPGWGNAEAFMRGYGRGPLTPPEDLRRRLYTLYQMLVMTIETDYRRFTDPGHLPRMRERLDAVLALLT